MTSRPALVLSGPEESGSPTDQGLTDDPRGQRLDEVMWIRGSGVYSMPQ